ncbi:hypothetical protein EBT16_11530, partial [bacterium]|nr:hypothetical protein [bacterium]
MKKFLIIGFLALPVFGARLKDIATLKGARANQLFGYGIVVGLAGSGDKSNELTETSLGLVLRGLGVDVKNQKMETKNAAAVVVTATLPPYSKTGTRLDVQVSSVGSASSLEGGTLMMASLRGADGKVYAMASGKVLAMKKQAGGAGVHHRDVQPDRRRPRHHQRKRVQRRLQHRGQGARRVDAEPVRDDRHDGHSASVALWDQQTVARNFVRPRRPRAGRLGR